MHHARLLTITVSFYEIHVCLLAVLTICQLTCMNSQEFVKDWCAAEQAIWFQAVVTGTAVSGVAVSLLRVITKAALPASAEGLRKSAGLPTGYC